MGLTGACLQHTHEFYFSTHKNEHSESCQYTGLRSHITDYNNHFTNLNTLRIPGKTCTLGTDSSIVNGIQMPVRVLGTKQIDSNRRPVPGNPWFVYPRTNSSNRQYGYLGTDAGGFLGTGQVATGTFVQYSRSRHFYTELCNFRVYPR